MPEGFDSIDDLKVAITASTEKLEAGLGAAKSLIDRFSSDGTSSLAKFDDGLARSGAAVAGMRATLLGWAGALQVGMMALSGLMEQAEKWAKTAGLDKEFGELKESVLGLGESLTNGVTYPLQTLAERAASVSGNLGKVGTSAADIEKAFGKLETNAEMIGKVDASSEAFVVTIGEVGKGLAIAAKEAEAVSSRIEGVAAAAARLKKEGAGLENPFGVKRADSVIGWITQEINVMRGVLETFSSDGQKSTKALDGDIVRLADTFDNLRQRLQALRSGNVSLQSILLGETESSLLKTLGEIGDRIAALQAERKSRPVVDPETFEKELEALDKQVEALDQKQRIFGMAAGEAARLVAEEKALAALGHEMKELSKGEQDSLAARLDQIEEITSELQKLAAAADISKAIEGLNAELAQIEFRTSTVGKSADEVARLTAEFKIQQLAKQKDVELTEEMTEKLNEYTTAIGRATLAQKAREAVLATDKAIEGLSDQVAALERQIAGYDMTAGAAASLAAEEKILADAKKAGIVLSNAQIDAMQDEAMAIEDLTDRKAALEKQRNFGRDIQAAEREADAMRRKVETMFMEAGAAAELTMQQKLLDQARRQGVDLSDTQRQRIADIARAYGDATREARQLEAAMGLIKDSGRLAANTLTSAFDQWMRGTEIKGRELVANLLREFARLTLIKTVLDPAQSSLTNLLGGLVGGGGGGIGSWSTSVIPAMASGGNMRAGVPTLVGERGPELVMPMAAARVIPNHALGGYGGGSNVNVTLAIDARGATRDTLPALEAAVADLQRTLPRTIVETMANARDRGMA